MIWIDVRGWVNLQAVIVLIGIFKKTVHWIQHFMGQQKKPLPRTQQWKLQNFNFIIRKELIWYRIYWTIRQASWLSLSLYQRNLSCFHKWRISQQEMLLKMYGKTGNCPVHDDLCIHTEYQNENIFKAVITTFSLLLLCTSMWLILLQHSGPFLGCGLSVARVSRQSSFYSWGHQPPWPTSNLKAWLPLFVLQLAHILSTWVTIPAARLPMTQIFLSPPMQANSIIWLKISLMRWRYHWGNLCDLSSSIFLEQLEWLCFW